MRYLLIRYINIGYILPIYCPGRPRPMCGGRGAAVRGAGGPSAGAPQRGPSTWGEAWARPVACV